MPRPPIANPLVQTDDARTTERRSVALCALPCASPSEQASLRRRDWVLWVGVGLGGALALRPARAQVATLAQTVQRFARGAPVRPGRVHIELASIVDNSNAAPLRVRVDSPMTSADHVETLAVFSEKNPLREMAVARFTPRAGRAELSTRVRLATTQQIVALARMSDGQVWSHTVDVMVTLAACIEELG